MKILYVNPARLESGLDAIIKGAPLSLISIAAMVPEHDAKLFDFKVDKYHEKRFRSDLNRYDVVAITSMTPQIYHALEVAQMAKEQGCHTILGGYHPTLAPEFVNRNNILLNQIDGLSYKDKDGIVKHNKERQLESNLDNFPMPRRDLLDDAKYVYLGARVAQLETSRGCPHNCKFCCIIKMWRNSNKPVTYRTKSTKRIMREIYDVNWKNDFIFFCEDNFTIKIKRTKKILETMIRSGVPNKMFFSCQSRVDSLYRNPWLVDLMHKAGMRQVFLGIESVHQQSLDAMNKQNTTPEMIKNVVSMLQDRGISIFGGVIIGFPGETKTMVRQNIQFARSLNLTCIQFTPITAFPGTEFYNEMMQKKMVTTKDYRYYDLFHPMMRTEQLTTNEMYELVGEAYSAYYLSKGWLGMLIKRYTNPFGKFNWMGRNVPRFARTVIKSGNEMLHSMGMSKSMISDELKEFMEHGIPDTIFIPKKSDKKNGNIILTRKAQKPVKVTH